MERGYFSLDVRQRTLPYVRLTVDRQPLRLERHSPNPPVRGRAVGDGTRGRVELNLKQGE